MRGGLVHPLIFFYFIFQGKTNEIDRAMQVTNNHSLRADLSLALSYILSNLGILSEALEYGKRSLDIHIPLNDRVGLAKDYKNIGNVLGNMGKIQEAIESHNKALEIDKELNDRVGLAGNYYNISFVRIKPLKSLYNAVTILQEFETENNYRHPLMEDVISRISYLKGKH